MRKLLCKLGIHKWKNMEYIQSKGEVNGSFNYLIASYRFKCEHCNKEIIKAFGFPYGPGTSWSRKEIKLKAKTFKGIK